MLQNSFYAISGTFYTLLNNTDLYLSYFILSYVFLGHNDSVEWGFTVPFMAIFCQICLETMTCIMFKHEIPDDFFLILDQVQ